MTQIAKNVSNNVIDNYIQRVTEWSQSSQRIPTTEELENIASELGIEPEEIQAAQKQSHDHYIRAQGYMRLKHWDDAISELQEAVAFNPSNLDMLVSLASAHMGRWQAYHRREDEEDIRLRIRQCLVIKPDCEEALNLLAKLSNHVKWRNRVLTAIAVGVGGVFVGICGVLLLGDGLPQLFQRESKLEQLEYRINYELNALQRRQDALMAEMKAMQRQNQRQNQLQNQRNISVLNSRIRNLQAEVNQLKKQLVQIEKREQIRVKDSINND